MSDAITQFREFVRLDRKHAGGLFVSTGHLLEIGTRVTLHIHVESGDGYIEVPAEVVSQNVGPRLQPEPPGFGLRFLETDDEVRRQLEELYEGALRRAGAHLGAD